MFTPLGFFFLPVTPALFFILQEDNKKMGDRRYNNETEDVGYNLMGNTGERRLVGNGFMRFLFEPFITFEAARGANGSLWRGAKKLIISYTLEAIGVFFFTLMVAGAAAGAFKSGLNVALIGLLVGVAHAALRYAISGWRHTPYLPRNLSPTFTWMRVFHGTYGAVWALIENAVQYGFAAIASAVLFALDLGAGDEWSGVGKFGTGVALGNIAAWALYSTALFVIGFAELYNQTITSKRFSYDHRSNHASGLVAFIIVGVSALMVHVGIYSNNEMIAFSGGLAAGNLESIGSAKWLILFILGPLTAIALIVFLKWLLWNVSDIPRDNGEAAKRQHRLDSVQGSDGGVPHRMEDRREVSSDMRSGNSATLVDSLLAGMNRKGRKRN